MDLFKGLSYRVVISDQIDVSLFAADNLKKRLLYFCQNLVFEIIELLRK